MWLPCQKVVGHEPRGDGAEASLGPAAPAPGGPQISARRFPRLSHRGRRGRLYLFIFISLYLIYGFTLDSRESIRVNFKYYLILQTRLLMLAVIRGGPLRGCQMEMRVAARAPEPAISKSREAPLRLGWARGVKRLS